MLLTITTTHQPATDLGYLLGKNPERTQSFELPFGEGHVYYPEATTERCTAALLLDVDPIGLVRRAQGADGFALSQYTNDRPYVSSSFLSVAIGRVFGQALSGRSRDRAELCETAIPLEARLAVLPIRGGEAFVRALFEPLGYELEIERHQLDADFPQWGDSPYCTITLRATLRLQDLLRHLTVLVPVLDDNKHYWVGSDEVDKLLARGEGWLAAHPQREAIAQRYLRHQRSLTREALARLTDDDEPEPIAKEDEHHRQEEALERKLTLNDQRLQAVLSALRRHGVRRVVDVGCGEGRLLRELVRDRTFERIVGMDVSPTSLERASARLRIDELSERRRARIELIQGSLTYRDKRLAGFDAACAVEVIEHIDATRLAAFEHVLFEAAGPACVIVTTPNVEYNVRFETLPAGKLRHRDHRFEWTRAEFEDWANGVAQRHGYEVVFEPIGPVDPEVGAPTQMGVFTR
ncbi:double-stranded RNA 3'-methylase [Enhygromyxa salina]|uniref:Small RNA 2'-O-methyltransferase n=1 Tax=Enhygromyxa salina TaxID=215803 RepID=A0A0C2CWP5_9BACT|nr:3' terminal RNA ribose 2'-O-methyltransferase Hen1 [Enhygromyxa salina]KIG15471.1 double-stranded RNA 3'-methylase [Enhygromyxa salina]